jgi:hypothetical protein
LTIDEDDEGAWCTSIFRPIYRPKADLIEGLKANDFREEHVKGFAVRTGGLFR